MRHKTSLTLAPTSMPLARARAKAEGVSVGVWLDRAILNEAARADVELMQAWEESLPAEDQAALTALHQADLAEASAGGLAA